MRVSYEGIGQWAATFACGGVKEGEVVKVSGSGAVSACEAGERFCGGVTVAEGEQRYLAVDVDSAARTVTFVL